MTLGTRLMLLALAAGVFTVPVVTAHAVAPPARWPEAAVLARYLADPLCIALLVIVMMASAPALGFALAIRGWIDASRALRALARDATVSSFAGMEYRRIRSHEITLFTAGLWRPAIYVTTAAEGLLTPEAFHAALLHERAHSWRGDVRWKALLMALRRAFRGLPWVGDSVSALVLRAECSADEHAIAAGAHPRYLLDAILLAGDSGTAAASGVDGAGAVERLRRLTGGGHGVPAVPARGFVTAALYLATPPVASHLLAVFGAVCGLEVQLPRG